MEIFGGLGFIAVVFFGVLSLLAPLFLYLTQRNTYQTRQEIRKTNKKMDQLIDLLHKQNRPDFKFSAETPAAKEPPEQSSNTVTMTCQHCGKSFKYGINHSGKTKPCPGCQKPIVLK